MSERNQDWEVRGPASTRMSACAILWGCIAITQRTKVRGTKTFTYCGVGSRRTLLTVNDPQPQPSTGVLRGPEADIRDTLDDFADAKCPTWFQAVSCDGDIKHFSNVYFGDVSNVNDQTANGPDATSAALIDDVQFQFDRVVFIHRPSKTDIGIDVTNQGYHENEVVVGTIDGVNTYFRLNYIPLDDYPVFVYVDGVLQVEGVTYTIDGRNITFVTPPACGEVVTATYYDERFAYYGLCPLRVIFCNHYCDDECESCTTAYALYQTSIPADVDTCNISDGMKTAVVKYDFDDGIATFESVDLRGDIVNPLDIVCDNSGNFVLAAESGFYEGCANDYAEVRTSTLDPNIVVRRLAHDPTTDRVYGLYGNSGIMVRDNLGQWSVLLEDGRLTTEYQNGIAAHNRTLVTVGNSNTVQIGESNNGLVMELKDGAETANYNILAVGIGPSPLASDKRALIYTISEDGTQSYMHVTENHADTWSYPRKTWSFVPTTQPTIHPFEDWLVYVQIGDETWRNANRACDKCAAWELLLESGYPCSQLTICHDDPNSIFLIHQPLEAALPDFQFASTVVSSTYSVDVLANDFADEGDAIDPSTLTIISNSMPASLTAVVNGVTNEIDLEVIAAPSADQAYIVYQVTTTNGSVLTGLLVVDFLA